MSPRCGLYCPRPLHVLVRLRSNVSRIRSNRQESRSFYNAIVLRRRRQSPLRPSEAATSAVTSRSVFRCRHEGCNSASPRQRLHPRELHAHVFHSSYYRLGGSDVRDALSLRGSKRLSSLAISLKGGIRRLTISSFCTCLQNQPHIMQADFLLPQEQGRCSDYSNLNPMYHLAATSGAQCTPNCSSCKSRLYHIHLLMLVADGRRFLRACAGGRQFVRKAL